MLDRKTLQLLQEAASHRPYRRPVTGQIVTRRRSKRSVSLNSDTRAPTPSHAKEKGASGVPACPPRLMEAFSGAIACDASGVESAKN